SAPASGRRADGPGPVPRSASGTRRSRRSAPPGPGTALTPPRARGSPGPGRGPVEALDRGRPVLPAALADALRGPQVRLLRQGLDRLLAGGQGPVEVFAAHVEPGEGEVSA